jgi:serine protease Do
MFNNINIQELAEGYINGSLSETVLNELKDKLATDTEFATEFAEHVNLIRGLKNAGNNMRFRNTVKSIASTNKPATRTIPVRTYYWRTAAIAAGIALLTSLTTYWVVQNNNSKIASQYSLLRRDLEKYKRSQNQLISNINKNTNTPAAEVRYTGTGFALTNDGYLVTNYHVIDGADSMYIQNIEGRYFKANVVGFDQQSDIAILKVDDKYFRFGKGDVPYSLLSTKHKLGTKVYTLGYPEDEVVYNEGYISGINGYNGDSSQYRLDLQAYPGQSGAPILDNKGNIIAMVTGKQSSADGTATYAVSSKSVAKLLQSLPDDAKVRVPKSNKLSKLSLEQQIEKLEYYTCVIKVYKK